ncbi:natriuretic peptide A-like [Diretmus argenteus]
MNSNLSLYCLSVFILLHLVGAKPISDLQSLKQLLEEEESNVAPYDASDEVEVEVEGKDSARSGLGTEQNPPWDSDLTNSALAAAKENALARLLKDIVRTSKRSWSRFKKGGLRSCFGVRMERIGSFSGLGC